MTFPGWDRLVVSPYGMDPLLPVPERFGRDTTTIIWPVVTPYTSATSGPPFPSSSRYPSPTLYPGS